MWVFSFFWFYIGACQQSFLGLLRCYFDLQHFDLHAEHISLNIVTVTECGPCRLSGLRTQCWTKKTRPSLSWNMFLNLELSLIASLKFHLPAEKKKGDLLHHLSTRKSRQWRLVGWHLIDYISYDVSEIGKSKSNVRNERRQRMTLSTVIHWLWLRVRGWYGWWKWTAHPFTHFDSTLYDSLIFGIFVAGLL